MSRFATIGLTALAVALLLGGLWRLRFDLEVLNLLPADQGVVQGLLWHQRHFQQSDELIVTLRAPNPDRAAAAAESLARRLQGSSCEIGRVEWRAPWQEDPAALAELVAAAWLNQPPADVGRLADRLAPANRSATLEEALETLASSLSPDELGRLAYDPYGLTDLPGTGAFGTGTGWREDAFASADGTFRVLWVRPVEPAGHYRRTAAWFQQVQEVVATWLRESDDGEGIEVGYTGRPAFVTEAATAMERDVRNSVLGATIIVCLLFGIAHRHWRPLAWLLRLLALILAGTLALGGWLFGALNVVSLGFAAILIGLSVDYALVYYQEARDSADRSFTEVRRNVLPAIFWSALTTAGAFLMLNLGALPGLHQLGTLVAGGVLLAAVVVLTSSPPVPLRATGLAGGRVARLDLPPPASVRATPVACRGTADNGRKSLLVTLVITAMAIVSLVRWPPALDHSSGALMPDSSPAQRSLQEFNREFNRGEDPLPLLIVGLDEAAVGAGLRRAQDLLAQSRDQDRIRSFSLPINLWPVAEHQAANLPLTLDWISERDGLRGAALDAGFTEEALGLLDAVLQVWERASLTPGVHWPAGAAAEWLLERSTVRSPGRLLALGQLHPSWGDRGADVADLLDLADDLKAAGIILSGWPLLGEAVLRQVGGRLPWVLGLTVGIVLICLYAAFRRVGEIGLSAATLGLSLLLLSAVMGWAGWQWNLMNLTAIPLLVGIGVDYTLHVQLALRRREGDLAGMRRTVGRALLLCAATTIAGFGSLAWANNPGLASLGRVCAVGIGCLALVALVLLPGWWRWLRLRSATAGPETVEPAPARVRHAPSVVYHSVVWQAGLWAGRVLPPAVAEAVGGWAAWLYARLHPRRRHVVMQNLLPVFEGDTARARAAAGRLFCQFGRKLAALLRHESGGPMRYAPAEWSGWEHLDRARKRQQGVLLVALHLGDWEFGGALLARLGLPLVILTQAEPGNGFTELRQAARRREGIDTVVVGGDPFAFIEVIRRLQEGAIAALLLDRPQPAGAVEVTLFNRRFRASIAAADLARATGCCLLPVYVVRTAAGCAAHMLPEVAYDRRALGDREARRRLTGRIVSTFEPVIRQYPDQWYHFIPLWPEPETGGPANGQKPTSDGGPTSNR